MPPDELEPAPSREAGDRAATDAAPVDDATGSASTRHNLVRVLVERTFRAAEAAMIERRVSSMRSTRQGRRFAT